MTRGTALLWRGPSAPIASDGLTINLLGEEAGLGDRTGKSSGYVSFVSLCPSRLRWRTVAGSSGATEFATCFSNQFCKHSLQASEACIRLRDSVRFRRRKRFKGSL